MQQRKAAEKEADPRVDLAVERTELALERTHLAWIRAMFAIITAGIAIDKGIAFIHEKRVLENAALIKNAHAVWFPFTIDRNNTICPQKPPTCSNEKCKSILLFSRPGAGNGGNTAGHCANLPDDCKRLNRLCCIFI